MISNKYAVEEKIAKHNSVYLEKRLETMQLPNKLNLLHYDFFLLQQVGVKISWEERC